MNPKDVPEVELRLEAIRTWCRHALNNECGLREAVQAIEDLALACKEYLHGGKAA